ncbi:MAG: hypothetical protein ACREVN_09780 [Gammaproteobacteria bacterium]
MQYRLPPQQGPALHPVARFLSFLGAVLALGLAFFLGLFFVAVVAGLLLLGALVIGARVWWLRRQIRQALARRADEGEEGIVIEGQYTVVDAERRRNRE